MHLALPLLLAAVLAGAGVYGVLARRNAVLVLVGVELVLNAGALVLVAADAAYRDALHSGQVLALFVVTLAAAEVGVALAVVLLLFRRRADIDLRDARALGEAARPLPSAPVHEPAAPVGEPAAGTPAPRGAPR